MRQLQEFLHGGDSWGIAIIRHGYLVREFYTFNVLIPRASFPEQHAHRPIRAL